VNLQDRLQEEVAAYNQLLEQENELQQELSDARDRRIAAFGRVQAVKDLLDHDLISRSLEATSDKVEDEQDDPSD
jgi:hypothetical protein